ncbi:MAG: ribonuclease P protein component [Planctomycetota bacterium]|nr:MAG: ribonuclease P protein component [Planctomycetota bacterium]
MIRPRSAATCGGEGRTPDVAGQRFPRSLRLVRRRDFQAVFASKCVVSDPTLVVHALRRAGPTRIGISVSRKAGNAVVRNRWKRLIREAFRRNRHRLPSGLDCVIRPRRRGHPDYAAVEASLSRLLHRADRRLRR